MKKHGTPPGGNSSGAACADAPATLNTWQTASGHRFRPDCPAWQWRIIKRGLEPEPLAVSRFYGKRLVESLAINLTLKSWQGDGAHFYCLTAENLAAVGTSPLAFVPQAGTALRFLYNGAAFRLASADFKALEKEVHMMLEGGQ